MMLGNDRTLNRHTAIVVTVALLFEATFIGLYALELLDEEIRGGVSTGTLIP